jgi:hypothetical protein
MPLPLPSQLPFLVDCCLFRCRHHPVHRRCRVSVAITITVAITVAIYVAISSLFSFSTPAIVINIAIDIVVNVSSKLLPPLPSPLKVDCCVCPSAADLLLSADFSPPLTPLFLQPPL